LIISGKRTIND